MSALSHVAAMAGMLIVLQPVASFAQGGPQTSATPPEPKSAQRPSEDHDKVSRAAGGVLDAIGAVNTGTGIGYDAMLLTSRRGNLDPIAKSGQKLFETKGKVLAVGSYINDAGPAIMRGDVPKVAKIGAAAVVDACIDGAITAACTAVSTPTAGAAAVPCVVAVQAIKFCGETAAGQTIGQYTVGKAEDVVDWFGEGVAQVRDHFSHRKAQTFAQHQLVQANNERLATASGASSFDAAAPAGPDVSGQILNGLLAGVNTFSLAQQQHRPPAPSAAPPANPSGCHDGHDEQAHPGGCHK